LFIFLLRNPYILLIGFIVFGIAYLSMFLQRQETTMLSARGKYEVVKVISSGAIIKIDGNNVLVKTKLPIKLFDVLWVTGKVEEVKNYKGSTFDYAAYLKTLNIRNIIMHPSVKVLLHSGDLRVSVRDYILSGPSNYQKIAPLVIMGYKTSGTHDIYNTAIQLSIVHLFVISGFHISFFYLMIEKLMKFTKIHKFFGGWFPLIILFVYLFLMNFPLSASRAFFLHLFLYINKIFLKKRFKSLDILAFTMAMMFVWRPYTVTSLSFIFTFLATIVIMIVNTFEFKNDFRKYIAISLIVYLSTIPISIYINGYFAPLGYLMGLVFTPILIFLYPLSIVLLPLKGVLDFIYIGFIWFLKVMNNINFLITLPKISLWIIQLIYLLSLSSFIIWVLWNLYTEKNNT
ncbi:MAG: ComEC/Rec2 family competence protein, partial [Mycoplasmataceae bacterium]|nr:ComEC/Rec2 family competence protein [Mycoplasmataceae bacterium]